METEAPLIFISYASPDRDRVSGFFDHLKSAGFNVWMDADSIKPGQNWDFEIKRALQKAALVVIFISNTSVDRRGYVQRELKLAIDKMEEKLVTDIYAIPVLLDDDAVVPEELHKLHFTKASNSDCVERIEDAIRYQLEKLGASIKQAQANSKIKWTSTVYRDAYNGAPGYEAEFSLLNLSSNEYPKVNEITAVIRGEMLASVMEERLALLETGMFNFGQDKWQRTNMFEAQPESPAIVGNVITILYNIYWYGAGAAHHNSGFRTFCYLLEPVALIKNLEDIFENRDEAFTDIQLLVRRQLLEKRPDDVNEYALEEGWVSEGTKAWSDFKCFVFEETGIKILFPPYQVAPYACGPQRIKIEYREVVGHMRRVYVSALGIDGLRWEVERKMKSNGNQDQRN